MFPDFAELDRQAAESEYLLAQMYDEALSRWVPSVEAAVLPTMADGTAHPPDPDGFTTQTALSSWESLSEAWVAPALMILWCYHHLQAIDALDAAVTAAGARKPKPKLTGRRAVSKAAAVTVPSAVEPGCRSTCPTLSRTRSRWRGNKTPTWCAAWCSRCRTCRGRSSR